MKTDRLDVAGKSLGSNLRIGLTIAAYLLLNSSLVSRTLFFTPWRGLCIFCFHAHHTIRQFCRVYDMYQGAICSVVCDAECMRLSVQNLLNKWALGSFFSFPLLLTTFHMLFSFVVRQGCHRSVRRYILSGCVAPKPFSHNAWAQSHLNGLSRADSVSFHDVIALHQPASADA